MDVAKAGRYGADVATVGAMVQLVTRGILLDTMRVDSSDEEIEIRLRLPEEQRVLSTLDTLKLRTEEGLVPLSNFVTRKPVPKLAEISRIEQQRYFDVKADVEPGLSSITMQDGDGETVPLAIVKTLTEGASATGDTVTLPNGATAEVKTLTGSGSVDALREAIADGDTLITPINANERIAELTKWLETSPFDASMIGNGRATKKSKPSPVPSSAKAFLGALGLMFVILLAQFNSFYNSVLVLLAVVLSTTGVLIGMMVMQQPFSIIMTGTGIVALAGIVVNNNIVLIDTYQEFSQHMPRLEAIIRTAEARIRPVLLTTITTMAGSGADDVRHQPGFHQRWLFHRQPNRAVVEAVGNCRGLWPWGRNSADAGGHTVAAGDPGVALDLYGVDGTCHCTHKRWQRQPSGA